MSDPRRQTENTQAPAAEAASLRRPDACDVSFASKKGDICQTVQPASQQFGGLFSFKVLLYNRCALNLEKEAAHLGAAGHLNPFAIHLIKNNTINYKQCYQGVGD